MTQVLVDEDEIVALRRVVRTVWFDQHSDVDQAIADAGLAQGSTQDCANGGRGFVLTQLGYRALDIP